MRQLNIFAIFLSALIGCGGSVTTENYAETTSESCSWAKDDSFHSFTSDKNFIYLGGVYRNGDDLWATATSDRAHLFHKENSSWAEVEIGKNYLSAYYIRSDQEGYLNLLVIDTLNRYGILCQSSVGWQWIPGPKNANNLNELLVEGETIFAAGIDQENKPQVWKNSGSGWTSLAIGLNSEYFIAKMTVNSGKLFVVGSYWNPDVGYDGCFLTSGPPWQESEMPSNCKIAFDVTPAPETDSVYVSATTKDGLGVMIHSTGQAHLATFYDNKKNGLSFVKSLDDGSMFWLASVLPEGSKADSNDPNLTLVAYRMTLPKQEGTTDVITDVGSIPLDLWVAGDGKKALLSTMSTLYTCD